MMFNSPIVLKITFNPRHETNISKSASTLLETFLVEMETTPVLVATNGKQTTQTYLLWVKEPSTDFYEIGGKKSYSVSDTWSM